MTVREKSDWAKFNAFVKQVTKLAGKEFGTAVAKNLAPKAYAIAKANMAAGRGPTGAKWKPRKADKAQALQSFSGALAHSANGMRLTLRVLKPQGLFHQGGAKKRSQNAGGLLGRIVKRALRFLGNAGIKAEKKIFGASEWKLPARRILPKKALPKQWEKEMVEVVNKTMKDFAGSLPVIPTK